MINRGRKDHEGCTACTRWKGREFTKPTAEFGERVCYAPAFSAGSNKFDVRWVDGVWLGVKLKSGESIIGTKDTFVGSQGTETDGGTMALMDLKDCRGNHTQEPEEDTRSSPK